MDPKIRDMYENLLNPDVLHRRLITASCFITAFGMLEDTIIKLPHFFICHVQSEEPHDHDETYSSEFNCKNSNCPRPRKKSLEWFRKMGAIDNSDLETYDKIAKCRNKVAHELFTLVSEEGLPPGLETYFIKLLALTYKIEKWWFVEIEILCNSDLDDVDVNPDECSFSSVGMVQLLCDIALGNEEQSRSYLNEFRAHFDR